MPVLNRSFLLLFAFLVSFSDLAFGTDHWGSHLQRHACDGNCTRRFQFMSGKILDDGSGLDSIADGLFGIGAEDSTGTHLFLSVHSADGVKRFSSGVIRSGKIEYGPLAFEMNSTSAEMPTEFRMLLDGEAAHPELFEAGIAISWTRVSRPPLNSLSPMRSSTMAKPRPSMAHSIAAEIFPTYILLPA